MPRQARLDAPGTLHHVMVRGIERTVPFRDDPDREDFLARAATLAAVGAVTIYAWALLPNYAYLAAGTRRPAASHAREGIAYLCTEVLGHAGRPLASVLGIRPQNVYRAAAQGRAAPAECMRFLKATC